MKSYEDSHISVSYSRFSCVWYVYVSHRKGCVVTSKMTASK